MKRFVKNKTMKEQIIKQIEMDIDELNIHLEKMKKSGISQHSFEMYEMGQRFAMFYMDLLKTKIEFIV